MEKTVNITNFIGVYDGYITEAECQRAINLFNDQDKYNKTINRIDSEKTSVLAKHDQQYFLKENELSFWWETLKSMIFNFDLALNHYLDNTGGRDAFGIDQFKYTQLKIQKTYPTEGYHVWHVEHNKGWESEKRAFVYTIYLNDVEEGGETEFLHFSKRVKPKTGRIVIWPAAFPYIHRGNPPLAAEKYILTSWMTLC